MFQNNLSHELKELCHKKLCESKTLSRVSSSKQIEEAESRICALHKQKLQSHKHGGSVILHMGVFIGFWYTLR